MRKVSGEQLDYARYRIQRAAEDLESAKILFNEGKYRAANNRAYYAIFHALRSLLALDSFDSKKHSGIIAEFRRKYIKTGVFDSRVSEMIGSASMIRNASDYDDMFIASRSETGEQIDNAEEIFKTLKQYLDTVYTE